MNERGEIDVMMMRYLDGRLSPVEAAHLSAELRLRTGARAVLRDVAEQAGAMADLERLRRLNPVGAAPAIPTLVPFRARFRSWQAIAALLVLGLGVAVTAKLWTSRDNRVALDVLSIVGDLSWTGVAGQQRDALLPGERLPAGTFATTGEGAVARLRFSDGSIIVLGGNTRVALAERGQKRAVLFGGILSAEVRPQPNDRPMIVETAAALLEVLATTFFVSADADHTTLNVDHGRVRLRRLADGASSMFPRITRCELPSRHRTACCLNRPACPRATGSLIWTAVQSRASGAIGRRL